MTRILASAPSVRPLYSMGTAARIERIRLYYARYDAAARSGQMTHAGPGQC